MLSSFFTSVLLDVIPHPIFVKNDALQFVYVNKAYQEAFGVTQEYMMGKTVLEIAHLTENEKVFYHNEDRELLIHSKSVHHVFNYEYKTGKIHTGLYYSMGFIQEDGKKGLIGLIVDITSQQSLVLTLQNKLKKLAEEKAQIEQESIIDPLTQVYNRRLLDEILDKYTALTSRKKIPLSCILIDIDHFKKINDTFGHQTGDDVLFKLAQTLKNYLRDNDVVFRYGGEEFLLLLQGSGIDGAFQVAERLRKLINETISLPDGQYITISAGCAEYINNERKDIFIKRTDEALYKAKTTGRNRVNFAENLPL